MNDPNKYAHLLKVHNSFAEGVAVAKALGRSLFWRFIPGTNTVQYSTGVRPEALMTDEEREHALDGWTQIQEDPLPGDFKETAYVCQDAECRNTVYIWSENMHSNMELCKECWEYAHGKCRTCGAWDCVEPGHRCEHFDSRPLQEALAREHCDDCDSNYCDIDWAQQNGNYLWAGHLLTGATECPKTEAAMEDARNFYAERWQQVLNKDCDDMPPALWQCPACGSYIYGEDAECNDTCSNCLHKREKKWAVTTEIDGVTYYLTTDPRAAFVTDDEAEAIGMAESSLFEEEVYAEGWIE